MGDHLDAIIVKIRDGGHVRNKAAHLAVGVDMDGIKHVLGIWVQQTEGAKFWASVCAELANRGVRDVLIVCCDGLTGFPEAIEATWPESLVQTCVVHLIRAPMRFVSYGQRKAVAAALKPIYQASDADAAKAALEAFTASELGKGNPHTVAAFENAWERFTPFLAFPPEVRRVIYTNAIESLNYQLRKVTKPRSTDVGWAGRGALNRECLPDLGKLGLSRTQFHRLERHLVDATFPHSPGRVSLIR